MKIWYEGETDIDCRFDDIVLAMRNPGAHYCGVVKRMPGLTTVELVDETDDSITIRTNEGLMTRTGITVVVTEGRVAVDYQEVYAGKKLVTVTSHFHEEFVPTRGVVNYRLALSGVEAPGVVGFLYRSFGSNKIGSALLAATKGQLEGGAAE